MKALLLTNLIVGPVLLMTCTFCLALVFSGLILWCHRKGKLPGWIASCAITTFLITASLVGMLMVVSPSANNTTTVARFIPQFVSLPLVFFLACTFPLPISIPVGLAFYFIGRRLPPSNRMTVVGCAVPEHAGGDIAFASAFAAKKPLSAWKLLTGSGLVAVALISCVRLTSISDFALIAPWWYFWVSVAQHPMSALSSATGQWGESLTMFAQK